MHNYYCSTQPNCYIPRNQCCFDEAKVFCTSFSDDVKLQLIMIVCLNWSTQTCIVGMEKASTAAGWATRHQEKKGAEAIKVWMPMSTRFRVDSYDWQWH